MEAGDPRAAWLLTPPVAGEPLHRAALRVLHAPTAELKAARSDAAVALWRSGQLTLGSEDEARDPDPPSRPARSDDAVTIVPPHKIKRNSSRLRVLHSLAHIESWAVDLSWDAVSRFGRDYPLPRAFFDDFVTVADDECRHFRLLEARLKALGSHYGAYEAHDALWESAARTAHSLPARLAVEHCVHEGRGLDTIVFTIEKMRRAGDGESAALLRDVILKEEITHCAAGVRWLTWLHEKALTAAEPAGWATDAAAHARVEPWFHALVRANFRGALRPPFNDAARAAAGFTEAWYLPLAEPRAPGKGAADEAGDAAPAAATAPL